MEDRQPVFDITHKALRNALGRFSLLAGRIDYRDGTDLAMLKELGRELRSMLESHMEFEESGILAAMDEKVPGSVAQDRREHREVEPIQAAVFARLDALDGTQSDGETHRFYLDFADFQSTYLKHLHHEETVTEPLLWVHFTDEELRAIAVAEFTKLPPPLMLAWIRHGFPAFSGRQRAEVFSRIEELGPPGAATKAIEVLSDELSEAELEAFRSA